MTLHMVQSGSISRKLPDRGRQDGSAAKGCPDSALEGLDPGADGSDSLGPGRPARLDGGG